MAHRSLGRQLVINSIATGALYVITALVGLWYNRFTVHGIGIAMVAVSQLAAGFINYMRFVTDGIAGSVGRFVMADFAKSDKAAANRTFNTYLVAAERVTLVLVVAIGLIVWLIVPLLKYPAGQLGTTRFVFVAVLGSAVIQVWSMCFDCAFWVSGRLDIRNGILGIELLLRAGTVFLLFTLIRPDLVFIGVACLVAPVGSLLLYILAWRKLTPELSLSRSLYDRARFREIRGLGGWLFVMQVGGAMQFNAELLLLNLLLGNETQGYYGMMLVWVNTFRGLFMAMGQLITPSVAAFHASGDHGRLSDLAVKAVRTQGLLISIPVGVLCGLAGPALNWWLGPGFVFLAPLAWLVMVPLVVEGSFYPADILVKTPETVPFAASVTVVLGIINILLGITLVKFTSLGMYGVAVSVAVTSLIRHGIILPVYGARLMGQPWYVFIQQQSQIIIQLGLTGVIALYVSQYLHGRTLPPLMLAAVLAGGVATCFALLQLSQDERLRLLRLVRRR